MKRPGIRQKRKMTEVKEETWMWKIAEGEGMKDRHRKKDEGKEET